MVEVVERVSENRPPDSVRNPGPISLFLALLRERKRLVPIPQRVEPVVPQLAEPGPAPIFVRDNLVDVHGITSMVRRGVLDRCSAEKDAPTSKSASTEPATGSEISVGLVDGNRKVAD